MKEILSVRLSRGQNAAHYLFHHNVLAAFTDRTAATLGLGPLRTAYAGLFAREEEAYGRDMAFELTPDIVALDQARNSLFLHVKNAVLTGLTSPLPQQREAAGKLAFIVRPYRQAPYRSYQENTALVLNMTDDLLQPDAAPLLEALDLREAVERLQEANDLFNRTFMLRSDRRLERLCIARMKSVRPQVDAAYRAAAGAVNALSRVSALQPQASAGSADLLDTLIDAVNAQVVEFRRSLTRRRSRCGDGAPSGEGDSSGADTGAPGPEPGGEVFPPLPGPASSAV